MPTMPTTVLADVQLQRTDAEKHDASLQEALTQKMSSLTAASVIGARKLEELSEPPKARPEVESVIFDHQLTTTQVRNTRKAMGVDVYERPAIIKRKTRQPDG